MDVSDANGGTLDVTFHGREQTTGGGEDFTIIALPDAQYYSQSYPATWSAQTQWIRDNRAARNIVFVTQLGDCVNDGDTAGQEYQWTNASAAIDLLESAPGLPDGIPYGIAVGNHDNGGNPRSGSNEGATTVHSETPFSSVTRKRVSGSTWCTVPCMSISSSLAKLHLVNGR